MDVKYINPFIHSLVNAMETMVKVTPDRQTPFVKEHMKASGDVSGIIGFASPEVVGSVALTFPADTALKIYEMMMEESLPYLDDKAQDTVGELTNIVAGGAKEEFSKLGISYHISIPTIVSGKNHTISHKGGIPVVVIPFSIEKLLFYLEVSMKVASGSPSPHKLLAEEAV